MQWIRLYSSLALVRIVPHWGRLRSLNRGFGKCGVGLSNMVSGLLGAGFTGSYIFSQTIFSMRAHVKSKLHGFIIAGAPPAQEDHRKDRGDEADPAALLRFIRGGGVSPDVSVRCRLGEYAHSMESGGIVSRGQVVGSLVQQAHRAVFACFFHEPRSRMVHHSYIWKGPCSDHSANTRKNLY